MIFALPFLFIAVVMTLTLVPVVFLIVSLIEVGRAPEQAFGPPWDNGRGAWLVGLAVAFAVPFGPIVGSILWWTQGRPALHAGRPVPKPFWAPARHYPPPGYPYPPVPPGAGQPPAPPPGTGT